MKDHADFTEKEGRQKAPGRIRKRDFRVSPKNGPVTGIPFPQRERVKQKYVAGNKMIEIARQEGIHRSTVAKIVKESDLAAHVISLREKFYGAMEDVMLAALNYVKNEKDGGKLAYEILKDTGIVPTFQQRVQLELKKAEQVVPEKEHDAVERIATALVKGAIERHRFFDLPLPEAEEIEEELREKEKVKGAD